MTIERTIPAGVRREIDREESEEIYLTFLTISHPSLADDERVVADGADFILGGLTFTGFQFSLPILTDTDRPPVAQLKIQNVSQRIGEVLREIDQPATLKLELIPASEFNLTVDPRTEIGTAARTYVADQLTLVGVEVNAMFITGRLQTRDYSREQWPGIMASQAAFPGLFR